MPLALDLARRHQARSRIDFAPDALSDLEPSGSDVESNPAEAFEPDGPLEWPPATDHRAQPADRRIGRWPWYVAMGLFVQYSLVGIWLIKSRGYMIFDALNRTITAQVLVLSRDPHLGAMGFYWPPLPMFLRVPFVLLTAPFDQTILSGPLSSALAAALVVPVLAKIGKEVGASTAITAAVAVVYALNPVTVFSGANAMSESVFAFTLAISLLGFIRYTNTRLPRDLALLSFGLALGMASRYEYLVLTVAAAVAVALFAEKRQRRSAMYMVVLPPAFVFALWTLASGLIANSPFYWYHASRVSGKTPEDHPWMPADLTPKNIVFYIVVMLLLVSPAFVVVGIGGAMQRFGRRGWIGILLISGSLPGFLALQLQARSSYGTPRYFALMPLLAAIAGLWVIGRAAQNDRRRAASVLGALVVATSLIGAVATTYAYTEFDRTRVDNESVLFNAIVGVEPPPYHAYLFRLKPLVKDLQPLLETGSIVAMDSLIAAPVLLANHPDQFILPEDRDFQEIMSDPEGRFDLVIKMTAGLAPSPYGFAIEAAVDSTQQGRFVMLRDYGVAQLWQYQTNEAIAEAAAIVAANATTTTVDG